MKLKLFLLFILVNLSFYSFAQPFQENKTENTFRPVAVPLLTIDPYFSCWSFTDKLYDENTMHWTEGRHELTGLIKVDGQTYRFMGVTTGDTIIPSAKTTSYDIKYTYMEPTSGWILPHYDISCWAAGKGAFNSAPSQEVNTIVDAGRFWLRREFQLNEGQLNKMYVRVIGNGQSNHWANRDLHFFINGKPVAITRQ